eukprot:scaffold147489_cov49-Attheya_sp.AAC.1
MTPIRAPGVGVGICIHVRSLCNVDLGAYYAVADVNESDIDGGIVYGASHLKECIFKGSFIMVHEDEIDPSFQWCRGRGSSILGIETDRHSTGLLFKATNSPLDQECHAPRVGGRPPRNVRRRTPILLYYLHLHPSPCLVWSSTTPADDS